ncbi:MAG: hypothetical protein AABW56_04495 [Nanoarchaeota archaeon]
MNVKKKLQGIIALPLFFSLSNSQTFQLDDSVKVMYEGKLYFVDQYNVDSTKRKYAYEIHSTDENGGRGNLIGDEIEEFSDYSKIALYGNFILDRYDMINDVTKFRTSLKQINDFYRLNKAIHRATLESVKFGTETALERDLTREKLIDKIESEYGEKPKGKLKEFSKAFADEFLSGKVKNKKNFERLVNSQFFDESSNKVLDVLDSLSTLQTRISLVNDINYDEFLDLRKRLYDNLRTAIELRTTQASYIILTNRLGSKSAFIGDQILKTAFDKIQDGGKIYSQLKRVGLNIENLNKGIEELIEKGVQTNIRVFNTEIENDEEQFNPKNPNSLASKFLKTRTKKDDFTINNLNIEKRESSCTDYSFIDNELTLYARGCDIDDDKYDSNWIKADFSYDLKLYKSAQISFDVETIIGGVGSYRVGLVDYNPPRDLKDQSLYRIHGGVDNGTLHLDVNVNRNTDSLVINGKSDERNFSAGFKVSNLKSWKLRIINEAKHGVKQLELRESKIRIKNFKVKFN